MCTHVHVGDFRAAGPSSIAQGLHATLLHVSLVMLLVQAYAMAKGISTAASTRESGCGKAGGRSSSGTAVSNCGSGFGETGSGSGSSNAVGSSSASNGCSRGPLDSNNSSRRHCSSGSDGLASSSCGTGCSSGCSCGSSSGCIGGSSCQATPCRLQEACNKQRGTQQQHLLSITQQLWQQLGLSPDVLPAFAAALEPSDLKIFTGHYFLHCVNSSVAGIIYAKSCTSVLAGSARPAQTLAYVQLSRQEQQLLPLVVWQLPLLQLLLASVLDAEAEQASYVETLVFAASKSVHAWSMLGLAAAANRSAAASSAAAAPAASSAVPARRAPTTSSTSSMAGASSDGGGDRIPELDPAAQLAAPANSQSQCPSTGLLSGLLDAWLGLMQSLLLQTPHGLLHSAGAATPQLLQQHICSCPEAVETGAAVPLDNLSGQSWSCFEVQCRRMNAVGGLLELLQGLATVPLHDGSSSTVSGSPVWCDRAPTLLLLLESLTRCVLPHHALCSDHPPSDAGSSSSSTRCVSDAAQYMRTLLARLFSEGGSSLLVTVSCSILQHGYSTTPLKQQQQQQQHKEPQQQPQQMQQEKQEEQQLPLLQQQRRLLHMYSLTASLLKLPVRPVTGVPLITGCIQLTNATQNALRQIVQHAAPGSSLLAKRLVSAPWAALTGRCL